MAQSGQVIEPGKRCRWITNDDQWSRAHGYESINAVAEITRINDEGMVFAYWHDDDPNSDQYGQETCIPNSAVVEVVDE
ncbi:MAG TPA: hypothetical protein VFQ60_01705 [Patescibacteria group bacterium]|nr:hypothetical protein [Patescibacteria group bacterium]